MGTHIGHAIERKYKESGMKLSEFARRLNTSPRNIYDIFDREEIKTDQLQRISEVLNYNFFSLFQTVEEAALRYSTPKQVVCINVELDGQEDTLNQWIERLTAINKVIR